MGRKTQWKMNDEMRHDIVLLRTGFCHFIQPPATHAPKHLLNSFIHEIPHHVDVDKQRNRIAEQTLCSNSKPEESGICRMSQKSET